jgi:hypothetical protein
MQHIQGSIGNSVVLLPTTQHLIAKERVGGSNPLFRSIFQARQAGIIGKRRRSGAMESMYVIEDLQWRDN